LQDVPVSVAVASGETLSKLNLTEATDLQFLAPGLGLGDSNTPRGAGFRIRGIGTQIFAEGVEQSVGTVIDGVPLARAGQGLADLVDIERIEVLRGPQGMLFGRNASAGVINIVTKLPDLERVRVDGRASYASGDDLQMGGSASVPISNGVAALRLTGFYNQRDGFVTNVLSGEKLNARKEYGLRGSLLLEPSDGLQVILRGDWSKRSNRANAWTIRSLSPASPILPFVDPRVVADFGPRNDSVSIAPGSIFNRVKGWGISGEINYEMGDYTLTSITGYRDWSQFDNNDADQTPLNVLDRNDGGNKLNQFSQELRITSPRDQLVSFVAGLFYYQSDNDSANSRTGKYVVPFAAAGAFGVPIPFSALGVIIPGDPVAIAPGDLSGNSYNASTDVRDLAAFGQATINVSDTFKIIAGARYTDTKVNASYNRFFTAGTAPVFNSILTGFIGPSFGPLAYDLKTSDGNLSWRAGLQYQPNRDLNAFATVSRGYKGPGFSNLIDFVIPTGQTALQAALIRPEIPTNYEVGVKGNALDRALDFSLTFFLTDFKDFQAQVFEVPAGGLTPGGFVLRNAGKLRTKGFEAELNLRPAKGFNIGFGVAYADTKYKDFQGASCPRVTQTTSAANNGTNCGLISPGVFAPAFDASGRAAANAPKWTLSVNSGYEHDLGGGLGMFIQGNALLRSDNSFNTLPANFPNPYVQDGYVVVNGTIGLTAGDGKYGLSVFVKNLFDKNFVNQIFDLPFGGVGDYGQFVTRDARRTVGVQARVSF
jgi:iron complex outermembrane recepter protein